MSALIYYALNMIWPQKTSLVPEAVYPPGYDYSNTTLPVDAETVVEEIKEQVVTREKEMDSPV